MTPKKPTRPAPPSSWQSDAMFAPYVPVAARKAKAEAAGRAAKKRGASYDPVVIEGRGIARTHWGKAFCEHLEKHCDRHNRLARGRSYARNGSVVHLAVAPGGVTAKVMGTSMYTVEVDVVALPTDRWTRIEEHARGKVASLLDLLSGRIPDELMRELANPDDGLFPRAKEMTFRCSCPDSASMCKHVAAVLYGVAARADARPELLFTLRGVDARGLVTTLDDIVASTTHANALDADEDLSALFGIELETSDAVSPKTTPGKAEKPAKQAAGKAPKKAVKKTVALPTGTARKRRVAKGPHHPT